MTRYAWEGRARSGAVARGNLDAPSKEAALAQLRASGLVVSRLEESAGEEPPAAPPAPAGAPSRPRRPGESLHDKAFYLGVAFVFTALGVGTAVVAPVLHWDCGHDAAGAVGCTLQRRVYGFFPLADQRLAGIQSVSVEDATPRPSMTDHGKRAWASRLVIGYAGGARWESTSSSWPFGRSHGDVASGLRELIGNPAAPPFRAWQVDGVPLLVSTTFQIPLLLILLGLLLRLLVPAAVVERQTAALEALARRRRGP